MIMPTSTLKSIILEKLPFTAFEFYIGNFCSMYKVFLTIQNGLIASKFKTQLSALKKSLN